MNLTPIINIIEVMQKRMKSPLLKLRTLSKFIHLFNIVNLWVSWQNPFPNSDFF